MFDSPRETAPANVVRYGDLDIPPFPYVIAAVPAPVKVVALHYRRATDTAPEIVEVRDRKRGELLTAGSRRGVYGWLLLHGYQWCVGMDGVWAAPQGGAA